RAEIVAAAERWSKHGTIYVLADDAYRELRYEGDDIPSTRVCDPSGETVIQAGTFSKCFSPGVRVGWGILPKSLVAPVHNQKGNLDFGSPNFAQHMMAQVIADGRLEPHIAALREGYRRKRDAMLAACRKHWEGSADVSWIAPQGGLYVWLTLPESIDAGPQGRLFDLALQAGMLYVPGQFCFPPEGQPVRRNTIRLSFGVQSAPRIAEGMQKLAQAIEQAAG
ncbi:MAG: PLP-dependent aminotransferase family protein, partial [Planctomycetales bacterium]|nr:PLP-dependent aminotransferase family protein [Planctomycetales bacterium]